MNLVTIFVFGLCLGILICMPIGPLNVWVVNTYFKQGRSSSLYMALGGSIMDFVYIMIAFSGLSLIQLSSQQLAFFRVSGVALVLLLGIKEYFFSKKKIDLDDLDVAQKGKIKYFLTGVFIYVSNPTLGLTMTWIVAFVKSLDFFDQKLNNEILFSIATSAGTFLWFILLVKMLERKRKNFSARFILKINKICGMIMIFLGLLMTYKVIRGW